jgi:hypothetical protein
MGFRDRRRAAAAPWRERRTTTTTLGGWATPATNQLANAVLLVGALVGDAYSWLLGALVARAWDADRQGPPARAGQRSPLGGDPPDNQGREMGRHALVP